MIEIFNPRADQMTDYTIAFLHILADHAAIAIENAHDVARIQQLTITDDCTGLYNVRHLYDVLGRELERCDQHRSTREPGLPRSGPLQAGQRRARPPGGQRVAGRTGQRLQELSRKQDLCFRYGGDEFVILMPETSAEAALAHSTKLLRSLMETRFLMKSGLSLSVSASVGLATSPADGVAVHAIIGAADTRMYAVKTNGRGQVRGA